MRVGQLSVFAALVGAAPPLALAGAGDLICVRISGTLEGQHITLGDRYARGGILPTAICDLEAGARYRFTLDGSGLERRIGALSVAASGKAAVHGLQFSAISRNVVLPGWGSIYAGRAAAGAMDEIGIAAALVALSQEELEYRHIHNRLTVAEEAIERSTTIEDSERHRTVAHAASRALNVQNDCRLRLALLAGALYAWQVVEPIIMDNPPGSTAGGGAGDLTMRGSRESRAKAFIYSLMRPGRGQFYQGKTGRGIFFSAAALAGGFAALHYQNGYDRAVDEYEICVERYEAADVISDKEELIEDASLLWGGVEAARDRRNASLIALAGVWGLNLVDTFFAGNDAAPGLRKVSVDFDGRGAAIAFRF